VPAPSGVVTFLFTDVEGSTRRWEADADAMRIALAAHDEVLRGAIEGHGGWLFKHTGDGVCAAFASPRSAVDAAVAAQLALELPVRMGIATGEAEVRDGDYFGAVLNRAARVMAAGHGGQVLLADSTAGLLSGVDLMDLGPRRLRDLPAPIGVFQVRAEGLHTDFPPLRALDVSPGNLRPLTTTLIGRESEATELEAAVRKHRLVTLTGVGGVGKTRLATEVAGRLVDEFPDGVWLFELAAVTDPGAVPDAVAAVLGIIQQPGKGVSESVAAALEGRVRLLVFDNCEHVLDAEASEIRAAHSRYFAGRETDVLALWDSPRQRAAYDWFTVELANLRTAFRWATDHGDLDVAATLATYAGWLGACVQTLEPITWAEELIEPARTVDHPRLAFLYVIASQCFRTGRIEAACRLQRRGPDRSRQEPRCAAGRHRSSAWNVVPSQRAARADGRVVPRPARTPPRHPRPHPVISGYRPCSGRLWWGGEGFRGWPHRGCGGNRQPARARVGALCPRCGFP
jgi:Adenylate and Guanylate cyclase catalytic domain